MSRSFRSFVIRATSASRNTAGGLVSAALELSSVLARYAISGPMYSFSSSRAPRREPIRPRSAVREATISFHVFRGYYELRRCYQRRCAACFGQSRQIVEVDARLALSPSDGRVVSRRSGHRFSSRIRPS